MSYEMEIKSIKRYWIKETSHRHDCRNDREFNYQSKSWRSTRNAFIAANPRCSCGEPATVADHIVRIKDGGDPYNWSNLQPMCKACHNKKDNNAK
jgi:5-methylcytosine-specific restriction endonuclease McrA